MLIAGYRQPISRSAMSRDVSARAFVEQHDPVARLREVVHPRSGRFPVRSSTVSAPNPPMIVSLPEPPPISPHCPQAEHPVVTDAAGQSIVTGCRRRAHEAARGQRKDLRSRMRAYKQIEATTVSVPSPGFSGDRVAGRIDEIDVVPLAACEAVDANAAIQRITAVAADQCMRRRRRRPAAPHRALAVITVVQLVARPDAAGQ